MTSRMEFRNYRSSAQLVHCNIHQKRYNHFPVNDRVGSQVTRLQTATSSEVMTPVSEDMTSYTELSDVMSPDLKRTYQALLSRGGTTGEYLPLFTSTPSRGLYSREISSWPVRDLETSTGESVNLSDTDDYVDVINA